MNIDQLIDDLIRREGGYVDNPNDKGGPTKYGITIKTLSLWLAREATEADVRNLDKRTAHEIYYSWYYIKPGINSLPAIIQPVMLDTCVNHGRQRAVKMLQTVLGNHGYGYSAIDGKLGDRTIAAAKAAAEDLGSRLVQYIVNRRVIVYENIVRHDETQRQFLGGWIARAESFLPEKVDAV